MYNLLFLKTNKSTTRLDTVLRSLNVAEGSQASLDSVKHVPMKGVPCAIPSVAGAAVSPGPTALGLILPSGVGGHTPERR